MNAATTHYHTIDHVGDYRYTHDDRRELERYLDSTGRERMTIRPCQDTTCPSEGSDDADYGAYD